MIVKLIDGRFIYCPAGGIGLAGTVSAVLLTHLVRIGPGPFAARFPALLAIGPLPLEGVPRILVSTPLMLPAPAGRGFPRVAPCPLPIVSPRTPIADVYAIPRL